MELFFTHNKLCNRLRWLMVWCVMAVTTNAQINTFPYFQNFETNNGGWTSGGSLSDWVYGIPNKPNITSAGSGSKCWINGGLALTGTGYNDNEESFVVSPVFDFTTLTHPWISFKIFWETEKQFDGGNLQYSINGGASWVKIGVVNDPSNCMTANWYNSSSISQLVNLDPSKQGWAGNHYATSDAGTGNPNATGPTCKLGSGSNGWVVAKHCLNGLGGQPNVKLRFTFASGSQCNYFDGLAFDDILIQNGQSNAPDFNAVCSSTQNQINFTSVLPTCPTPLSTSLLWNFGDPSTGTSNTSSATNPTHAFSTAGIYTVSLTQSGGPCNPPGTITKTVSVLSSSITVLTQISCFNGNDGSVIVAPLFGTGPYTYSWSPTGATTNSMTNLSAGNYYSTVTDSKGCKKQASVSIINGPSVVATISQTDVTCSNLSSGQASVSVFGGNASNTFTWLPMNTHADNVTGLSAGNYSLQIMNFNGCGQTETFTIAEPANSVTVSANVTGTGCSTNSGTITVTALGASPNTTYNWTPSVSTTTIANAVSAGVYTIVVNNNISCPKTITVAVVAAVSPSVVLTPTDVSCFGLADGKIKATITGGSTPYTYGWLPSGGSTAAASNLSAGNYSFVVSDGNGCRTNAYTTITEPSDFTLTVSGNQTVCASSSAMLTTTVVGAPTNTVNWQNNNINGASISVSPSVTTTYTAQAINSNGCKSNKATTTVYATSTLSVVTSPSVNVCQGLTTTLATTVTGGNGNYQYNWLPNHETTSAITFVVNAPFVYTVTANDICSSVTGTVNVLVTTMPMVKVFDSIFGCAPLCMRLYDSTLINNGNIAKWDWHFSNGQKSNATSPNICFNDAGKYTGQLNVTTTNNCSYKLVDFNKIRILPKPKADFTSSKGFESTEYETNFTFTNSSSDYVSVHWNPYTNIKTTDTINESFPEVGTYSVTLVAINTLGCNDTITKEIKINPEFTFFAPNAISPEGNGLNDVFLPKGMAWDETKYTLTIFDRWGQQIFTTNDAYKGWNGTYKGLKTTNDIYVYKVELTDIFDKDHVFIGHVMVVK